MEVPSLMLSVAAAEAAVTPPSPANDPTLAVTAQPRTGRDHGTPTESHLEQRLSAENSSKFADKPYNALRSTRQMSAAARGGLDEEQNTEFEQLVDQLFAEHDLASRFKSM